MEQTPSNKYEIVPFVPTRGLTKDLQPTQRLLTLDNVTEKKRQGVLGLTHEENSLQNKTGSNKLKQINTVCIYGKS